MNTQIKRLLQQGTEFVPITLAEAVVVNATNIPGLSSLGITTLDKVLRTTLGIAGVNAADIVTLNNAVTTINNTLSTKQDKLTAGTGINIDSNGVISATATAELYKIVVSLPTASKECGNVVYLVLNGSSTAGNLFTEYLCVHNDTSDTYYWETIGTIASDVDLSNYVTQDEFNAKLTSLLTAENVTTSSGSKVLVSYSIPTDLYDNMVGTSDSDYIITE